MGILFFLNCIVIFSAFLLSFRVFALNGIKTRLIALMLFSFAQIVAIELILGILGILWLNNVVLLTLAVNLSVVLLSMRVGASRCSLASPLEKEKLSRITILLVSIIAGCGIVKLGINLVNPPFGWDSLNYHFSFPVEWLKGGNLNTPITVFDDPGPTYYPINGSLYFLWLILPLNNFFLADFGQAPFFVLSVLSVFAIARKLGLSGLHSGFAACLFITIPNIFKQLQVAYVDVMVAGLFLACVYFIFLLNENFSWKNVSLFSLSLGLLVGTKTVGLVYSILLVFPFIYLLGRSYRKIYLGLLALGIVVAFGGFSYLRNWYETANPLYPLHVTFLGKTLFKGVLSSEVYRAHFVRADYSLAKLLFSEGLGAQTLLFVLPATLLALPVALFKRIKLDFLKGYFLLLPILIYLMYFFILPYANARYLYALLGIGLICAIYSIKLLAVPGAVVNFLVVISALSSCFQLAKHSELVGGVILSTIMFFTFRPLSAILKGFIKDPLFVVMGLLLIMACFSLANLNYENHEYYRYESMRKYSGFWPDAVKAWRWMNDHTVKGNSIAYAGRPVPLPLYGTRLKNSVYYVSVNKVDPAKLHYFPSSNYHWGRDFMSLHKSLEEQQNYRGKADYSAWLNNLQKRKTDFLFVYSLHQTKDIEFPFEDRWARENPGFFSLAFTNATVHIYRVLR